MCDTHLEEKLYILVLLDHVVDVDVHEHVLEPFYIADTPLNEFLEKNCTYNMCHTYYEEIYVYL